MGISSNQARLMTLTARQHDLELRAQQISAKKMIKSLESQQWAMKYSEQLNLYSIQKTGVGVTKFITNKWLNQNGYVVRANFGEHNIAPSNANYDELVASGKYSVYKPQAVATNYFLEEDFIIGSDFCVERGQSPDLPFTLLKDLYINSSGMTEAEITQILAEKGLEFDISVFMFVDINNNALAVWVPAVSTDPSTQFDCYQGSMRTILSNVYNRSTDLTRYNYISNLPTAPTDEIDITALKAEYDSAMASLSTEEKLLDMELTQINTEHNAVKTEYDSVKGLVSENTDKSFNVFG